MTTSGITNPLREWQRSNDYHPGVAVTRMTLSEFREALKKRQQQTSVSSGDSSAREARERSLSSCIDAAYNCRKREEKLAKLPFNAYTSL